MEIFNYWRNTERQKPYIILNLRYNFYIQFDEFVLLTFIEMLGKYYHELLTHQFARNIIVEEPDRNYFELGHKKEIKIIDEN